MSEKQLKFTLESDRQYIGIFDEGYALTGFEVCNLLNSLYQQCEALQNENEQLRQEIKHCVYVVDNEKGCMNCKFNFESHCIIMCCRSYDYIEGISKCNLKYWKCKEDE